MVTTIRVIRETRDKQIKEIACLSTDTKPINGVANGSMALEINTGDVYAYDEASTTWIKL